MATNSNSEAGEDGRRFPATRHSAILRLRSSDADERARAWDTIASIYWKPVYTYIRLKWNQDPEEASDLTQGFFLRVVEKDFFHDYDPARARFRTFLRVCLDGFLKNTRASASRLKRGSDARFVSLELQGAESEINLIAAGTLSPEELFEREWIQSLFERAVGDFRAYCEGHDRAMAFAIFEAYDLERAEGDNCSTYADLAAQHGVTIETVTNHLAYARREFRRIVLDLIRDMSATEEEFRDEVLAILGINLP